MFSPDGTRVIYVRDGDHDQAVPPPGNPAPNAALSPEQPVTGIWSARVHGGNATKLVDGDGPAISARGMLAFLRQGQVWTMPLQAGAKPELLFSDRGRDGSLQVVAGREPPGLRIGPR